MESQHSSNSIADVFPDAFLPTNAIVLYTYKSFATSRSSYSLSSDVFLILQPYLL